MTPTDVTAEARARARGLAVLDFDPERDPELRADPFGWLVRARRHGEAFYSTAARGFWVLSSHELVSAVLHDAKAFSKQEIFVHLREPSKVYAIPSNLDPPAHPKYRRVLNPLFTPARAAALVPAIRAECRALLDELTTATTCEVMGEFAFRLPALVFAEEMGLPRDAVDIVIDGVRPPVAGDDPTGSSGHDGRRRLFADLVEERRREPRDDVASYLVAARVDGAPIPDDEITTICATLLGASLGTTAAVIGHGLAYLAAHPAHRDELVADPTIAETAADELLRCFTSAPIRGRVATVDVDLAGVPIRAGDRVALLLGSANGDPALFELDTIDLRRSPNPHLTFGVGPHRCLGAHLARTELQVVLEEWHRRIPDYHLGDPSSLAYEVAPGTRLRALSLVFDEIRPR